MYKTALFTLMLIFFIKGSSQNVDSYLVVYFDSKNGVPYSLEAPSQYLTERAIERRLRFAIPIDSTDLPVNPKYIDSLFKLDIANELLYTSRWLNCAVVTPKTGYKNHMNRKWIKHHTVITTKHKKKSSYSTYHDSKGTAVSGNLTKNHLDEVGISRLHKMGLTGKGVLIAILDAGFRSVNTLSVFDSIRERQQITATRDFVEKSNTVYDHHTHGTAVTALLSGIMPEVYHGSAPESNFILIRTENATYESRLEEFNWLAGAEYADSLGADIINSSLGYSTFDNQSENYSANDLTGNVTICSKAAGIVSNKGIFVVSSAGNDGDTYWRYINFPSDSPDIFTIGATDADGKRWSGSSIGMPFHSYKPDFMSRGVDIWIPSTISQGFYKSTGTSFSAPIFAGGIACLLQYYNDKTPLQVKQALKETAANFNSPNNFIGYGLPDFYKAFYTLQNTFPPKNNVITINTLFYDKLSDLLNINIISAISKTIYVDIYDSLGRALQNIEKESTPGIPLNINIPVHISNLPQMVLVVVRGEKFDVATRKIMIY